jgi:hypothetical protein
VLALKTKDQQRDRQEADSYVINSIESLAKDPELGAFITPDIKRDIALECAARGDFNPRTVFLDKYGNQIIAHAKAQAVKEYAARVQATNASGAGLGVPTGAAPMATLMVDPASLSKEEANKWSDGELDRIARDPKYAAQLAKEFADSIPQM